MNTLTVRWEAPAVSDTASSYTVKIHTDNGVSTFTAAAAGTWANIPWDNQPATAGLVLGGEGQFGYSYTLPTPTGLTPGEHATPQPCCHDLEVCASLSEWWPARHVHPTYTRVAEDGGGGGVIRNGQGIKHQPRHSLTPFSCAAHLCCAGYYRAVVEAVNTATPSSSANSGSDRAALGDPGPITINSVKWVCPAGLKAACCCSGNQQGHMSSR